MPRHYHHHNVRRNPEISHKLGVKGADTLSRSVPAILEKMTWGKNELILDRSFLSAKFLRHTLMKKVEETESIVHRIDNCKETLEFHKKHHHHDRIKHTHVDLSENPGLLGDLMFNKVFSIYGLFLTPTYRSELKAIYDHMLPGGEGFFLVPFKSIKLNLMKLIAEDAKWKEHSQYLPNPDYVSTDGTDNTEKLKEAFTSAGFTIKEWDIQ